ncbi:SusC/RagA family TonB-linked outer membrane protein [Marinifilum breve]|uniref:SusC/RagA family TonB-linked outer membrane protein n=1 Tax=Marinifilum breve TaxID=2184082 RepID=A0A2V3ZYJ1_9BACT|nr:SusC/RagA family TonB-linked outer membrane protein [Marinifilum breve]PXY01725.1 SusC/RagA family TonB-linked outer membrane protein [Marinifilum breve]
MKYLQQIDFYRNNIKNRIRSNTAGIQKTIGLFICMLFFTAFASAQTLEVKGKVLDGETKESLPGVSIIVKGTSQGASTNLDGDYTLKIDQANAILVFSFIGYESVEVPVNGRSTINVNLNTSTSDLDEVMVVAYGTTKKSNLTGSAVALDSDDLKDVFVSNVSSMLQGKVAGVNASSRSGRPGASTEITIRGKGSLSGTTAPLWVVDGIIMGNSDPGFSPADIESMTILKDASATALYGSLAANGVILLQTKRAKKGESKINVNATYGFTTFNTGNFSVMNSQELYDYQKTWNPDVTEDVLNTDTDWMDIATQTGKAQEYNVNYSGGNEKIMTYLSGTYYNETGALKGYEYERYSAIANLDINATDRLKIKLNLSGDYKTTDNQQHSTYAMFTYMPWDEAYLPDGSVLDPRVDSGKEYLSANDKVWYGRDENNYLYDLQYNYGNSRSNNLRANIGFDYKINDWLTFSSMNNIAINNGHSEWYTDPRSISGQADKGTLYESYSFSRTRFTNQMLRFNKTIGLHVLNAFVAWEYTDSHSDNANAKGKGIAAGLTALNTTAEAASVGGSKWESAKQSMLVNLQYAYDDRYLATASFSRQGSSSFGPNKQYGNFWSASLGWNAHSEEFLQGVEWLNTLKWSASMGQVGNAPGGFQYLGYYAFVDQYNGSSAATPYQKGNPDISWEKVTSYNTAINTRLFDRVSINLDLYYKNSDNLLTYVPLPALTGYNGIWMNVGRVTNKGYELSVSPEIIKTARFKWDMTLNIAYNKNRVEEIYEDKAYTRGNTRIEKGYDMDAQYQRIWYGANPANGEPLWEKVTENEDGTKTVSLTSDYADATLQFTGTKGTPTYTGGILNKFTFDNFTLSANISFVEGIHRYNSNRELFDSDGSYASFNSMNLHDGWNRWEKPGDVATHPKSFNGGVNANKNSSRYLEDASYIRLRNVTLAYNLPKNVLSLLKLSNASVFVSGDNLITLTDWSGMDPEIGATGYDNTHGALYPMSKKVMVGVKVGF